MHVQGFDIRHQIAPLKHDTVKPETLALLNFDES